MQTDSTAAARTEHDVPDDVVTRLQSELRGTLSQRQLRHNEQSTLARELLAAMTRAKDGEAQV